VIEFVLDGRSKVNTYVQLVQQVKQALRVGLLSPGDQLPKVRDVAQSLAINPNTVLKAYRELEIEGLAEGRPGVGTFVKRTLAGVAAQPGRAARRSGRVAGAGADRRADPRRRHRAGGDHDAGRARRRDNRERARMKQGKDTGWI
jgi:GntR family transcriptional regulator